MEVVTKIDSSVIETLFQEYYDALCRYSFSILKKQDEAEDVVQKLFVKLWEKRDEIEIWRDVRSYLYRSTHNLSLNEVKRIKRTSSDFNAELSEIAEKNADSSALVLGEELETQINDAINKLPEKCAKVFKLSRMKDMTYKEIAEELSISVKTVENHMGKALRIMREELSEYLPLFLVTILILKEW